MVQIRSLAYVAVGWGALAFAAVVVLTLFAARTFDERLLWEPPPWNEAPRPNLEDLPAAVPARTLLGRLPLVWILPAVVVLVGGFVVIREKLAQGDIHRISFANAEGLEANKTKVRYKDVEIGEVAAIRVGDDRKEVIVTAEIHRNASAYLVDDNPLLGFGAAAGIGGRRVGLGHVGVRCLTSAWMWVIPQQVAIALSDSKYLPS